MFQPNEDRDVFSRWAVAQKHACSGEEDVNPSPPGSAEDFLRVLIAVSCPHESHRFPSQGTAAGSEGH